MVSYSCMPQGDRNESEKREFEMMLPCINILYLGASCLLLVDLSYRSRFWVRVLIIEPLTPTFLPLLLTSHVLLHTRSTVPALLQLHRKHGRKPIVS